MFPLLDDLVPGVWVTEKPLLLAETLYSVTSRLPIKCTGDELKNSTVLTYQFSILWSPSRTLKWTRTANVPFRSLR